MEESIGTMETTKAAYDRMFELKIITPQVGKDQAIVTQYLVLLFILLSLQFTCHDSLSTHLKNVLNYAAYLEEHHCYEEAFRIYERGVNVFKFPHSREIWLQYINRFIQRYQGSKLERARDIFERVRNGK